MSAPSYSEADMHEQVREWFAAAEAYRAGQNDLAIAELAPEPPPEMEGGHYFGLLVAKTCLGAYLCGMLMAQRAGQTFGEKPTDGEWIAEAVDPRREGTAVERFVAIAITTAANGEIERVNQQVEAFADPSDRGLKRLMQALLHILRIFTALNTDEETN